MKIWIVKKKKTFLLIIRNIHLNSTVLLIQLITFIFKKTISFSFIKLYLFHLSNVKSIYVEIKTRNYKNTTRI